MKPFNDFPLSPRAGYAGDGNFLASGVFTHNNRHSAACQPIALPPMQALTFRAGAIEPHVKLAHIPIPNI